jgi:hypothetical protein
MKASFSLQGFLGLQAVLAKCPDIVRLEVGAACHQTALAIQRRAVANAPKDRGDLARSIQIAGSKMNWRVGLVDQDLPLRGGRNSAHRNPSVYGVWYEYGFKTRNIARHPFMGPAANAERERHEERLRDAASGIERKMVV